MRKSGAKKATVSQTLCRAPLDCFADAPKGGLAIDQRADGIAGPKRIGASAAVRDIH